MPATDFPRGRVAACLLVLAILAGGCAREPETGPGEIRWDRNICARCSMVISERHHAAQVRGGSEGQADRLYLFDDIGCVVSWLDAQAWGPEGAREIWVAGHEDGAWLVRRLRRLDGEWRLRSPRFTEPSLSMRWPLWRSSVVCTPRSWM